jgi:hypothetical protein
MNSANTDRITEMISASQPQLAAFAKESYTLHGRGIIRIEFPSVPPNTEALVATEMVYHDLAEMRRLMGEIGEDEAITLRMIETYDPERQAVVMAAIADQNPITVKMRLEAPVIVDGPTTLQ